MVVDVVPFFREFDLLELRLAVLDSIVDRFVIVEGTRTFSGQPKPLWFVEHRDRYAKWLPKIRHVVVDDWPDSRDPWLYENHQRNAGARGLGDLPDDAQLIVSDLDEIPNPDALARAFGLPGVKWLLMRDFRMFVNAVPVAKPLWFGSPKVLTYGEFRRTAELRRFKYCKFAPRVCNQGASLVKVRRMKDSVLVRDGGWHFSFLGGIAEITRKIQAYSHQERNTPEFLDAERLKRLLAEGRTVNGSRLLMEPLKSLGLPSAAREVIARCPDMVAPLQGSSVRAELARMAVRAEARQRRSWLYLSRWLRAACAARGIRLPVSR